MELPDRTADFRGARELGIMLAIRSKRLDSDHGETFRDESAPELLAGK